MTLLIVRGNDEVVIGLNESARRSGASHLFEEPGKVIRVFKPAVNWFTCFPGGKGEEKEVRQWFGDALVIPSRR